MGLQELLAAVQSGREDAPLCDGASVQAGNFTNRKGIIRKLMQDYSRSPCPLRPSLREERGGEGSAGTRCRGAR